MITACTASRSRCGSSGPATVIPSCTAYTSSLACAVLAWKSRPCWSGVSGSTSAIRILPLKLVDLLLVEGDGDIGGRQPASTALHVCANAGQGLNPQPAQPADPGVIQRR